ncbi:MAG: HAD family phosphatase [Betaproteobacteria bacterium]|nr:HAD family phosphatase [Betaproteobacteria bacterium]
MNAAAPRFAAVIFDMDGLLLDSERIAFEIGRAASEALGIVWREEVAFKMIGRNAADNAQMLLREYGADYPLAAHMAEFGRRYDALIAAGGIPLKPGAIELLNRLDELRIPRAVATSTAHARAAFKLERVGLLTRFDALVGGDEITHGKPAPDIFLAAAQRLGVAPASCLALEDSNTGAQAALAAGMQVRIIPDLLGADASVLAAGARALDSLHDVLRELS